jgi:glutamate dehydrogenase
MNRTDAGDPANDAVRVNGNELRCRVVAEGGNLGFTQLARIEYALAGGRINTDFIDNSGGVDSSDREVNIKILLNAAIAAGRLTLRRRNRLLAAMTDELARLVLANNYAQTQALSVIEARAHERHRRARTGDSCAREHRPAGPRRSSICRATSRSKNVARPGRG